VLRHQQHFGCPRGHAIKRPCARVRGHTEFERILLNGKIVPRVHNSNETERSGRITKRGSKLERTALVQCALMAKRYSPCLANYYERIRRRRGTDRAIIVLARKLLGIIYHTLRHNWVFSGFSQFHFAGSHSVKELP
jgi:hypothetical protein